MTLQGADDLNARLEALRTGKANKLILGQFGLLAVKNAKERVPRKTGNLGRTIRVGNIDVARQTITITAGGDRNVGYARYVEEGTRAHIIVPVRRKALAWGGARRLSGNLRKGAKATNFAKRVHHPGTRAQPFLVPGAKQALADVGLADAVITVWNSAA